MPCAYPLPAKQSPDGGRPVVDREGLRTLALARRFGVLDAADRVLADSSLLFLPCGACVGCRISRAREWAIRCSLELMQHSVASFVTLTYDERYVPPTLSRPDLSLFFRYLRRKWEVPVRFFGCGEYGEWRGRPHYHALVFGIAPAARDVLEEAWGRKGFVTADAVTPARVSYAAGYCAKKLGFDGMSGEFISADGEVFEYQRPFLQMSRNPGIAGDFRKYWQSWRRTAVWNGVEVPVPRFLHASWQELSSESDRAALTLEKLESRMVPTMRELAASEAMASARVNLKSSGRTL